MKKLILTIVGFISLTSVNWAQTDLSISDFPSTLNFTDFNLTKTSGGTFDPSTSEWNKVESWDYGPGYRGVRYRVPAAGTAPSFAAVDGAHTEFEFRQSGGQVSFGVFSRDANTGAVLFEASYSGPSLSELSLSGNSGFDNPPATFNSSWFANGLSPSGGFPVGGAYTPTGGGGGSVITQQAQELNIGLEFTGGQWVPTQQ